MDQLTKDDSQQQRNKLAKELRECRATLADAIEDFNRTMEESWEEVENAQADYNQAVVAAGHWLEIHEPEYDYELEESNLEKPVDLEMQIGLEFFSDQLDQLDPVE